MESLTRDTHPNYYLVSCHSRVRSWRENFPSTLRPWTAPAPISRDACSTVHAEGVDAISKAKAIMRYGIGHDPVDAAAAHGSGIPAGNIPDSCIDEVADHTLAFIPAIMEQLVPTGAQCIALVRGRGTYEAHNNHR